MPINEERLNKMREFGLTDYQARVYLTLLDLGESKASQIPSVSRVPRTRIYSTMNQLHEKGLVEIIPETPIKYRPVPIGDYLEKVAEQHMRTASDIIESKERLMEEFSVMAEMEVEETGRFEAIYGRRNVRERLSRMYEEAESEILSIGTAKSPIRIVRSRLPTIEEKFEEGVSIKYAFPIDNENRDNAQILSQYADVRNIDMMLSMYFLVVDGKQALMCHPIPPDDSFLRGDDIAIWTNDEGMAEALKKIALNILDGGFDLEETNAATPLFRSAKAYIDLLGIETKPVIDALAYSVGDGLSTNFEADTPVDLMEELAIYWRENSLGDFKIVKKRPLTVQLTHFVKCAPGGPKKSHSFCNFVQSVVDRIVKNKLDGQAGVKGKKCLGNKDGYCNMTLRIG